MVLDIKQGLDIQHLSKDGVSLLPWWTKPALDELETMELSGKKVFEYSCGLSSIYFAHKAKYLTAVESNKEWYDNVNDTLREHSLLSKAFIWFEQKEEYYVNSLNKAMNCDLIVVDGIFRDQCVLRALEIAQPGTIIVLDNWMQDAVWVASKEVQEAVNKHNPVLYYSEHPNHIDWCTAMITIK